MSLDKATVRKISELARIDVPDADLEPLARELSAILGWIEQLGEVDTDDVAPMRSVMPITHPWRLDVVDDGDQQAAITKTRPMPMTAISSCPGGRVMATLTELGLAEARRRLVAREISAAELTQAHLDAMEKAQHLNAFITETPELALEMAAAADARLAKGEAGLLEGLPIAIKDLFCTEGVATTAGSHILDGFVPPYESTVTRNLWAQGAVSLGKTNLDEFAMGSSNMTSYHGPVRNPWTKPQDNAALVPGGSSGGSAAAVAARIALAATGTDTGGSIRQPAAFCGITGIKPTYGRCSRLRHRRFRELARPGRRLRPQRRGHGPPAPGDGRLRPQGQHLGRPARPGLDRQPLGQGEGPQDRHPGRVPGRRHAGRDREALAGGCGLAEGRGAEIVEINLPHTKYALPTYYIIAPAEASSNLARYDGMRYGLRVEGENLAETYMKTRAAGFGAEVKRRIMIGTYVLSAGYYDAYYLKAQKVRRRIVDDFEQAFQKVDAILTPTAPSAAFRVGEKMDDPVAMYLNDVFTVPSSLAGLPGIVDARRVCRRRACRSACR
jgi:aspartyl-tRNA(Asn)/glutamyl-tRNA(Gln) amidotransferase subunit A